MPSQSRPSATPRIPAKTSAPSAQMSTTRPPSPLAVGIALAIVYVIWGSTYLGIRIVVADLPAFGSAAIRFGVAAFLLAAILGIARGWRRLRVSWRQLGACAVVGVLLLAGGNGLVVLAESPQFALPSGVAALVISLNPLIMVTLRAVTGDRPSLGTVAGVVIGLAGLVALFLPGLSGNTDHPVPIAGGLLALGAVTCWCVGSFATRWLPMPSDAFVASAYEMLAGAASMALIAVARGEPAPWLVPDVAISAWLALAYLIVFGSLVAFSAYIWLLQHAPISLVSTYAYVNPMIAIALGALVAGEVLTNQIVIAAAVVVIGVILVVSIERPGTRREA
jgi:drug/metabolite transporter (DMT)-like permease